MKKFFRTKAGQWRMWVVIAFSLSVAVFGFIPGMGIPGGIVMGPADALLKLFGAEHIGYTTLANRPSHEIWGTALLTTWFWPIIFPFAYLIAFRLLKTHAWWKKQIAFWLALLLWAVIVTFWIEAVFSQGPM